MVTLCWAAKGGSGTTVVTASIALASPRPALLVDLDGELPAVLGLTEPVRPGVADWLATDTAASHLDGLLLDIAPTTWLLPWRSDARLRALPSPDRWAELGAWLHTWADEHGGEVTIDAGTGAPPEALVECVDHALLVTRPCYLSLRRAVRAHTRPTGVILVHEPGRALRRQEVEHALGAPVEAVVAIDPAIARAVDAGLLANRLPRSLARGVRGVAA
jgi:MinD superfamily P-loop ATPase